MYVFTILKYQELTEDLFKFLAKSRKKCNSKGLWQRKNRNKGQIATHKIYVIFLQYKDWMICINHTMQTPEMI